MENENPTTNEKEKLSFGKFHDRYYKLILILPLILLLFSLGYMFYFYSQNDDFIKKDISLTGGTTVTLFSQIDSIQLEQDLSSKLLDLNTRKISDLITQQQKAVVIETKTNPEDTKKILEEYLKYSLTDDNSSFEFTGSTLSEGFYKQLLWAIFFAFLFMAIVVFLLFRTFVPSSAVVLSAFADILMTLVTVNLLGMTVSSAGIIAFLMLIGYSVDTDILLTIRMLKRTGGSVNKNLFDSFKTGITMTLTALLAVLVSLLIVKSLSVVLEQIFIILFIGLIFDIFNTWVTNVSIIKWYVKSKKHED